MTRTTKRAPKREPPKPGQVWLYWRTMYVAARQTQKHRAAQKQATALSAKRFGVGGPRVEQLTKKARRMLAQMDEVGKRAAKDLEPTLASAAEMRRCVREAEQVLREHYPEALAGATAIDMLPFSHKDALKKGSPQQTAAALARALVRAHKRLTTRALVDEVFPAYAPKKFSETKSARARR